MVICVPSTEESCEKEEVGNHLIMCNCVKDKTCGRSNYMNCCHSPGLDFLQSEAAAVRAEQCQKISLACTCDSHMLLK